MKIALITDIHEDLRSLQQALRQAETEKCDEIACLGDMVGTDARYYPYASERDAEGCVTLIRRSCRYAVAGNHDLFALRRLPEYKNGFRYTDDWYAMPLQDRLKQAGNRVWPYEPHELPALLSEESRTYLSALPEWLVMNADGQSVLLSHFRYPDPSGSLTRMPFVATHLWGHFRFMKEKKCTLSFSGHMHPQGILSCGRWRLQLRSEAALPLRKNLMWYSLPALSSGSPLHGFSLLDTRERSLRFIPLHSPAE